MIGFSLLTIALFMTGAGAFQNPFPEKLAGQTTFCQTMGAFNKVIPKGPRAIEEYCANNAVNNMFINAVCQAEMSNQEEVNATISFFETYYKKFCSGRSGNAFDAGSTCQTIAKEMEQFITLANCEKYLNLPSAECQLVVAYADKLIELVCKEVINGENMTPCKAIQTMVQFFNGNAFKKFCRTSVCGTVTQMINEYAPLVEEAVGCTKPEFDYADFVSVTKALSASASSEHCGCKKGQECATICCQLCETFVECLKPLASDTTEKEFLADAQAVCNKFKIIPQLAEECLTDVNKYAPAIFGALKGVLNPPVLCKQMKACY